MDKRNWFSAMAFSCLCSLALAADQHVNLHRIVTAFGLTDEAKQRLLCDGIPMLANRAETNLWKAYDDLTRLQGVPIFVTRDACLYQFYELHKAAVRRAETNGLLPPMRGLLSDWAKMTNEQMTLEKWLGRDVNRPEPSKCAYSFRWSAMEQLDSFTELRNAEAQISANPQKSVALLKQVAKCYEGKRVGAKARLLLARHFLERQQFEEARAELEAFYRYADMHLWDEAEELLSDLVWRWAWWSDWRRAQPYVRRLLTSRQISRGMRNQDLRAIAFLKAAALLSTAKETYQWLERALRECPNSRFVPAIKVALWYFRFIPLDPKTFDPVFDKLNEEQQRRVMDKALVLMRTLPPSISAWSVAKILWINKLPLLYHRSELERFVSAIEQLRQPDPRWAMGEESDLLGAVIGYRNTASLSDGKVEISPQLYETLALLRLQDSNFEGAWKALQKVLNPCKKLKLVLEAWKNEGEAVGKAAWNIAQPMLVEWEQALEPKEIEEISKALAQACEEFSIKFPKSRLIPWMLQTAADIYWVMGWREKARSLWQQLSVDWAETEEGKDAASTLKSLQRKQKRQEAFVRKLLAAEPISSEPYEAMARENLTTTLDKLITDYPYLTGRIVAMVLDAIENKGRYRVSTYELTTWLRQFTDHHPNDPLAWAVRWQLDGRSGSPELLCQFASAPEGTPYRTEAQRLLDVWLEKRASDDPIWFPSLLKFAERFPSLAPKLWLAAGQTALSCRDFSTAKTLFESAIQTGDAKVKVAAQSGLEKLQKMQQPSPYRLRKVWELDLWRMAMPSANRIDQCLDALDWLLKQMNSRLEFVRKGDTDGRWVAVPVMGTVICVDMKRGKVAWTKSVPAEKVVVIQGIVVTWDGVSATAFDAASGKLLWRQKLGREPIRGRQELFKDRQHLFYLTELSFDFSTKLTLDLRTGKVTRRETVPSQVMPTSFGLDGQRFIIVFTDEQGRWVGAVPSLRHLRSPDGTTIVLLPDWKLAAYKVAKQWAKRRLR